MKFIKDKSGAIVLAVDDQNLYYFSQEPDEYSELNETEKKNLFLSGETDSISYDHLSKHNNGGVKLFTILDLQKELGIISALAYIKNKIKKSNSFLAEIIIDYEKTISYLNKRVILFEREGSGPASAWMDYLFLFTTGRKIDLCSSRYGYLSASEKIEYYGLGDNEYWGSLQANGEFIEAEISDIKSAKELYDGIVLLLKSEEQWNMSEDKIDWSRIIDILLKNNVTNSMGLELRSIVDF